MDDTHIGLILIVCDYTAQYVSHDTILAYISLGKYSSFLKVTLYFINGHEITQKREESQEINKNPNKIYMTETMHGIEFNYFQSTKIVVNKSMEDLFPYLW